MLFGTFLIGWYGKYFTTDWPRSCIDGFEIIYWKRFHFLADTSASSGCQCECFQFIRNSMKRTGHIEGKGWHIAWISWIFSLDLKNFGHFTALFSFCGIANVSGETEAKIQKYWSETLKILLVVILEFDNILVSIQLLPNTHIFFKVTFIVVWIYSKFLCDTVCQRKNNIQSEASFFRKNICILYFFRIHSFQYILGWTVKSKKILTSVIFKITEES